MNNIHDLYKNCKGKRVLVRFDGNIPEEVVERGEKGISLLRLERARDTIHKLSEAGARVILMTHLGDDGARSTETLIPLFELYNIYPSFYGSFDEGLKEVVNNLEDGEVLLLQNVRTLTGETTNDPAVVDLYTSLGEVFVNEAFSVSHRDHASVSGIAKKLPAYLGEGMVLELHTIDSFIMSDETLGVIIGGDKLSTKLPLVKGFLENPLLQFLMLGGALAHPYYESLGYSIGDSLTDKNIKLADIPHDTRMFAPELVRTNLATDHAVSVKEIRAGEMIWDADPKTLEVVLVERFKNVEKIFWNGQLGKGDSIATHMLVKLLMNLDKKVVMGGGDTLVFLSDEIVNHKNIFVSTGGGALLDYLGTGTLVGIEGLR
ncbi:MAG TPA: phosphoglycerate kinase [Candidatus Paceibacterota bacterium]